MYSYLFNISFLSFPHSCIHTSNTLLLFISSYHLNYIITLINVLFSSLAGNFLLHGHSLCHLLLLSPQAHATTTATASMLVLPHQNITLSQSLRRQSSTQDTKLSSHLNIHTPWVYKSFFFILYYSWQIAPFSTNYKRSAHWTPMEEWNFCRSWIIFGVTGMN